MAPHRYHGNCHCGSIRFELRLPQPLETTHACQCGLCAKKGYLWLFPARDEFEITRGGGEMTRYCAQTSHEEHFFCPTCGTGILVKGHETPTGGVGMGVNARALLETNPFQLKVERMGQASHAPSTFTGPKPEAGGEGWKVYTGGCHCGAVGIAVRTKPLPEIEVKEDNCSICQRNANTCMYPNQTQVTLQGEENLVEYRFGRRFTGHRFCGVCGVPVGMKLHGPPQSVVDRLPAAKQEMVRQNLAIMPLRVGILDGVEWSDLKVERSDEGTEGYVVDQGR
ncbi:hypothetical protein BO94DRAFT_582038 [Aspergillus sclerotioniger CBS 115572]|uniref:CENP-V/GFA domain-containing protein n=1 Tax=Aspergillus sclerotioniger CBS 115572 TaxID=1450535 RepID=A0A317XDP0_9EURO|nr:hypothetical protein BO94DRAFT_582038 [Aspergillus sclerotioniger CBS 115572]PWY94650.1 hypothetical protein BO94DRAFT_582038 [Aspergillus sclerotioniger CBS 115572]